MVKMEPFESASSFILARHGYCSFQQSCYGSRNDPAISKSAATSPYESATY